MPAPTSNKLLDPDPYTELIAWKFLGAAVWHAAVFALGAALWHAAAASPLAPLTAVWRLLWSPADMARLAVVWATSLAVLAAQQRLLAPSDVEPIHLPAVGAPAGSCAARVLSRCIVRTGGPAAAAALYAAAALSGAVSVASLAGAGAGHSGAAARWLWGYGAFLGAAFAAVYLARAGNVLAHPIIQRPRYFRVKGRVPAAARAALALASATAAAAWLAPLLLLPFAPRGGGGASGGCPVAALAVLFAAWRAGVLCAFAWAAGAHVLEVVFTERIAFAEDAASGGPRLLLAALQHRDPLIRFWALSDLAAVAEAAPGRAGALAAVFGDETGLGGWVPLARYCLAELEELSAAVAGAAAVPAAAAQTGGGGGNGGGIKWNSLKQIASGGGNGKAGRNGKAAAAAAAARAAALADWHVRGRYAHASACLRALAALAAASLERDRFGVAQLSSPSLGDAVAGLVAAYAVLRQHAARLVAEHEAKTPRRRRVPAALGPPGALFASASGGGGGNSGGWGGCGGGGAPEEPAAAAAALLDVATTAAYRAAGAFGPAIRAPTRDAAAAAAKRGAAGAAAVPELLESLLAYDE